MSGATWQDVAAVLVARWPAGPGNKPWEREQLDAYVAELKEDNLTPHWAIIGLRASDSDFVPSAGGVRRRALEVKGPLSSAEIADAEERFYQQRSERTERLIAEVEAAQKQLRQA